MLAQILMETVADGVLQQFHMDSGLPTDAD